MISKEQLDQAVKLAYSLMDDGLRHESYLVADMAHEIKTLRDYLAKLRAMAETENSIGVILELISNRCEELLKEQT